MAGYIGSKASVVSSGAERKKTFTITGSTTSLTGLNYTVGKVHVFQNGVRLVDGTDYTATNSTTITLTVAAQNGDNVVVISQASYQVALSGIDDQSNATALTIDSSENVLANTTSTSVIGNGGFAIKPQTGNGTRVDISNDGETMLLDGAASGPIIGLYGNGTSVGSIGVNGSRPYLTHPTYGGLRVDDYRVNPATTAGANWDNALDLGAGGSRWKDAYLSGGIYLGGAVAANKLDDYEEGTFTVGFQGATVSANNTTALYTKIGDLVTWYWYSSDTAISSASGAAYLTGLPFTVLNTNNNYNPVLIAHNTYFGGSTSIGQQAYHLVGNDKVVFNTIGQANNPAFVNGSGKFLMIQGSYKTAS